LQYGVGSHYTPPYTYTCRHKDVQAHTHTHTHTHTRTYTHTHTHKHTHIHTHTHRAPSSTRRRGRTTAPWSSTSCRKTEKLSRYPLTLVTHFTLLTLLTHLTLTTAHRSHPSLVTPHLAPPLVE
jgi:hypothetical protein